MIKAIHIVLLLVICLTTGSALPAAGQSLHHYLDPVTGRLASGDGQLGRPGEEFPEPLKAEVRGPDGRPAGGVTVQFDLMSPGAHYLGQAVTDSLGRVSFPVTATSKARPHSVVASIEGGQPGQDRIVYNLQVRTGSWVLFLIFGLAGGLSLFLFGMNMMSKSLQRSAGGRMRAILSALTVNRFVGVAVGAFVTMVIQSSSATTVMLVSFVQAQLMTFGQTLGVILGADIGTTVTAQLIAFKLTDYALLMIAVGFLLRYTAIRPTWKNTGEVILGFGLLFFGMYVMTEAMYPLRSYQPFLHLLTGLENPWLGILVGTVFTALIQSSSAFTGIVIVLAQQGFLTLDAGIPLIFGANIGTCITAALAAIGTTREAARVALAHTLFKVLGVLIMVWWIPSLADLVRDISPGPDTVDASQAVMARVVPRQVANAHTVFNVGLALLFLPFTGLMARLAVFLLPDRPEPAREWFYKARHLDADMMGAPSLALNLAKVEILRLGEKVKSMAIDSLEPFLDHNLDALDHLHREENKVDALDEQITDYLVDIGKQELSEEQTREVYMMLHVTKQFEHIADIIDKQIRPLALKMVENNAEFSETGQSEVQSYHLKMCKQISRALEAFRDGSLELAQRMSDKQRNYVALEEDYRQAHFQRIHQAVTESVATSEIHLELMDSYRRISSYSTNVGRAIMRKDRFGNPDYEEG
ncbi:MAG: Na/Pi cotransporter family protein [Candidatus Krumholzibacteriota bacterium]